jgi:hypothetical protein
MTRRVRINAAWWVAVPAALLPANALAHGVQGRADTPIPVAAFFWAAGAVLIVSFFGLALGWRRPLLTRIPWRRAPRWLERIILSPALVWTLRMLTLAAFFVVLAAAAFGSTLLTRNLAPLVVFVVWWVGLVPLTMFCGNVWREINPWATLARLLRCSEQRADRPYPPRLGWWPASGFLLIFAWLELVYTTPAEPRTIAALIVGYSIVTLVAMRRWGIQTWLDHGEVFTVYTSVLAHVSSVEVRWHGGSRRLGFRPPFIAVTHISPRPAMVAFIGVLIATVTFDGLSGSEFWTTRDVAAAERLINLGIPDLPAGIIVATIGLLVTGLVVITAFETASWASARAAGWPNLTSIGRIATAFAHTLIPIALAYFVAHYFTLFVFQAQDLIRLVSDPFGRGWDLFGTADHKIDFQLVSANVIWAVQVTAIVVGHVVALALAHDRALQLARNHRDAVRSQWPMLILMVLLTVAGLWSLSEGMASV